MKIKKRIPTKIALITSVVLIVVLSLFGTSASIAWFKDETPAVENVFNFSKFDIKVEYKNSAMTDYAPLETQTNVFLEDALYEPGYTQVVYLKVTNNGSVNMKYKLAIDSRSVTTAISVLGNEIYLPNHLKYGALFADSETMLNRQIAQDNAVINMAELRLNPFTKYDSIVVAPGQERYIALVVYMPTEVDNVANYRGATAPAVNMGLTIYAEQATN